MKFFIKLFLGAIALIIIATVTLAIVIDPNDYKQQIQKQVKQNINRELVINGDISWSFYPQIGFNFGEMALNNPAGFSESHLLKIDNASVGVALLPLIKGEVQIGEVTLNGLNVNLITDKNGVSNLDNMTTEKAAAPATNTTNPTNTISSEQTVDISKIQLAGINIENVQIKLRDFQLDTTTTVDIKHIHLGQFTPGKATSLSIVTDLFADQIKGHLDLQSSLIVAKDLSSVTLNNLELKTQLTGESLPNGEINSTLKSNINYDLANSTANLNDFILNIGDINLQGKLSLKSSDKTTIRFDLKGNHWNLTPYIAVTTETPTDNTSKTPAEAQNTVSKAAVEQEPDLSFLNSLDVKGQLAIAGISADTIKIGEINTTIEINKGKAQIKPLTAQLYQGLLTLNASIDSAQGHNRYQLNSTLKAIEIHPLLQDAAGIDLLSGTTAFNISATGEGLTTTKIKSGIVAKGDFTLLDGELYGINIPQKIRELKAKLTGKSAPTEADIKKTDFASLTGFFTVDQGVFTNSKLLMLSPVLRLDGSGLANILDQSLDYYLSVTPLSKSTENTTLQELNGITIPLTIKGTFTDPKFSLDTEGALAEKAKERLEKEKQKLKEKAQKKIDQKSQILEDKLKSKLNSLFN